MPEGARGSSEVALPALLRAASAAYSRTVRAALADNGFRDLPGNGPLVLLGVAEGAVPLGQLVGALAVTKQAAGQLVEVLVARGYLDRSTDTADRRRLSLALTDRGRAAADVVRSAVDVLDAELSAEVGAKALAATRHVLTTLAGRLPGPAR